MELLCDVGAGAVVGSFDGVLGWTGCRFWFMRVLRRELRV